MQFSPTTRCFYPANISYGASLPADVVAVSDVVFAAMMARPPNKIITVDVNGQPVLSDPVGPTLAQAQAAQTVLLSTSCQVAITAGAVSSALGSPYTYPTKTTDQTNLAAAVNLSTLPGNAVGWTVPIMCESAIGVWARVPHTMAQVQKAGQDVFMQILGLLMKNDSLSAQVAAAGSVSAVQLITW